MIKLEDLQQGDLLFDGVSQENLIYVSCFEQYLWLAKCSNGFPPIKLHVNSLKKGDFTSWKRDGVELLKQEEEKPLYVFCPIDKVDSDFLIEYEPLNKYGNVTGNQTASHIEEMNIGFRFGEYTFIGYSTNNENPKPLVGKSPLDYCFKYDLPKVAKYAVFMKTSELHVGGE